MDDDELLALRTALLRAARLLNANAGESGLTPTQVSVLSAARFHGPLRSTLLARREGLNPTMLSRVLTDLAQRGLIARSASPDDRRVAMIETTAEGRALIEGIQRERGETLRDLLLRLSGEHRDAIMAAVPALLLLSAADDPESTGVGHADGASQATAALGTTSRETSAI